MTKFSPTEFFTCLIGLIVVGIAACVLFGWYTEQVFWIRLSKTLPIMTYNTALCLLLDGIALILLFHQRFAYFNLLCALFALMISAWTLCEYILPNIPSIDQWFMHAYISEAAGVAPGRIPLNTTLCILLQSTALLLGNRTYIHPLLFPLGALLSLMVAITGMVVVLSFLANMPTLFTLGTIAPMALHTALCFELLGMGTFLAFWQKSKDEHYPLSEWLPSLIVINTIFLLALFAQAATRYEYNSRRESANAAMYVAKDILIHSLNNRLANFSRLAYEWQIKSNTMYAAWYESASSIVRDDMGYHAIGWVDSTLHVRWAAPNTSRFGGTYLPSILDTRDQQILMDAALAHRSGISRTIIWQNHPAFLIYTPLFSQHTFGGWMVGLINAQPWFDTLFNDNVLPQYDLAIWDGGEKIYWRGNPSYMSQHPWLAEYHVTIFNIPWTIRLWRNTFTLTYTTLWIAAAALLVLLGFLLALAVRFAQTARVHTQLAHLEIDRRKEAERELAQYASQMENQALTDELTQLDNRRALSKHLTTAMQLARYHQTTLSILMVDLDHFKEINDNYGHLVGDKVLQQVAQTMRQNLRSADTVSRYGGEEFCIILLGSTGRQATLIANKLRQKIMARPLIDGPISIPITCSIGVCQLTEQMRDADALISGADQALYQAKNSGRNTVVLYSPAAS